MNSIELVARWNVGGITYLELLRDTQGFFYRWQGSVVPFSADSRDKAMETCEKLIAIHFPEASVKREEA